MKETPNIRSLQLRYLNGNRKTKSEILQSLQVLYGYHRKSGIRLLRSGLNRKLKGADQNRRKKRGARGRYQDVEFKTALRRLWKEMDYICSKNFKSAIPQWLPYFEKAHGEFPDSIKVKLLSVSASTIDRILKSHKH